MADAGHGSDAELDLAGHGFGHRTMRRGESHEHFHMALGRHLNVVDEAEIVDVDRISGS
jgi:hypothetical protein